MRRPRLLATLLVLGLGLLAACSESTPDTGPQAPTTSSAPGTGASGDPTPVPAPTTAPTTTPTGPDWVGPVLPTKSAACGTARADAVHDDFTTPGGRTFHVWGPSGYDPNKTYPVVIVFHGIYSSGTLHEDWFKMENQTDNEAFVVYPDAVGGFWDTSGNSDLVFFDEMMKQLAETYCINPSRVLGFGFSYGGHFADHLACKRAGYVKAVAIGDGGPSGDDRTNCGRLPILITSRTVDTDETIGYAHNAEASWVGLDACGAAGAKVAQVDKSDPANPEDLGYCVTHAPCKGPGSLTFCEDPTTYSPAHPEWNHTVREYYRHYTYEWFKALP